jgi:hypothetical protein
MSTLITEKRLKIHSETVGVQERARTDLFLSTIKSFEKLPIEMAEFHIEFDESTENKKDVILTEIRNLPFTTEVHNFRFEKYEHWKNHSDSIKNIENLILLLTYDDHIFIDSNIDEVAFLAENIIDIESKLKKSVYGTLSHFPECHGLIPFAKAIGKYHVINSVPVVPCAIPIGAVIVSPKSYSKWWVRDFTYGSKIVSPENPFGPSVMDADSWQIFPRSEIFRHMDGYSHVRINSRPYGILNPNYIINEDNKVSHIPFSITHNLNDIRKSKKYDLIYIENNPAQNMQKNLILANQLRISMESTKYIATKYGLKPAYFATFRILIMKSNNKKLLIQTLVEAPTLATIRFIFFVKKLFKRPYTINEIRFTSMFSSHKTVNFMSMFISDKLRRLVK